MQLDGKVNFVLENRSKRNKISKEVHPYVKKSISKHEGITGTVLKRDKLKWWFHGNRPQTEDGQKMLF